MTCDAWAICMRSDYYSTSKLMLRHTGQRWRGQKAVRTGMAQTQDCSSGWLQTVPRSAGQGNDTHVPSIKSTKSKSVDFRLDCNDYCCGTPGLPAQHARATNTKFQSNSQLPSERIQVAQASWKLHVFWRLVLRPATIRRLLLLVYISSLPRNPALPSRGLVGTACDKIAIRRVRIERCSNHPAGSRELAWHTFCASSSRSTVNIATHTTPQARTRRQPLGALIATDAPNGSTKP